MPQYYERNHPSVKEGLADVLINVDHNECPVSSMAQNKGQIGNILGEHTLEKIRDEGHTGAKAGADVTEFTHTPKVRVQNVITELRTTAQIDQFLDLSDTAGVGGARKEMAHQLVAGLKTLKRKREGLYCGSSEASVDNPNDPGANNQGRSIHSWIKDANGTAAYPIPDGYRPSAATKYTGAVASFAETNLKTMIAAACGDVNGPIALIGVVGHTLKNVISDNFGSYTKEESNKVAVARFNQDRGTKNYINVTDRIVLDGAEIWLMLSWFLFRSQTDGSETAYSDKSGLFFRRGSLSTRYMKLPETKRLEDKGGGPRALIRSFDRIDVDSPLGSMEVYTNS